MTTIRITRIFAVALLLIFAVTAAITPSVADPDRNVAAELQAEKAQSERPDEGFRTQSSTYTAQATSNACFHDPSSDTMNMNTGYIEAYPKADLVQWCASFISGGNINLAHQNATPTSPTSDPNWLYGITGLLWDVDVNGDHIGEYGVYYYNNGSGLVVEVERYSDGAIVCGGQGTFDGMYYDATFATSCVGNPTRIWTDAFVVYDSQWDNPDAPLYSDIADSFGGPVETTTTSTPPADDTNTQPAPDDGASKYFADVTSGPHVANIDFLYEQGLVKGCATDPLRYCPNDPLTRAQYATVMAEFIRSQQ